AGLDDLPAGFPGRPDCRSPARRPPPLRPHSNRPETPLPGPNSSSRFRNNRRAQIMVEESGIRSAHSVDIHSVGQVKVGMTAASVNPWRILILRPKAKVAAAGGV